MEKYIDWVANNIPWVSYLIMALGGGAVAHIRDGEGKKKSRTLAQHVAGTIRRSVYAIVAGGMWYGIMRHSNYVEEPLAFVGASLVGLFAPEFFDYLWLIFKNKLPALFGFPSNMGDPDKTLPGKRK